ncbi:hypothetical protein B0H34DRAFT_697714 [Crassisporium funariophilum]|nr:hypothetical protein B0H34DRAFT_697714 [Crassisporium funariophilum]
MHHRDPRPSYTYDDQNGPYPSGNTPHHSSEYMSTGYHNYDSSGNYYAPPAHGLGGGGGSGVSNVANPSNPYFRSMTPSIIPAHRHSNSSRDGRYISSQGVVASSSSVSQPMYAQQNQYYQSQYIPTSDQRSPPLLDQTSHSHQRIPTPSEIAHSYSNYPHHMTTPQSPTIPEDHYASSSLDYPAPPHMVPSSHAPGSHGHRPSRIVTGHGRPRTVSSAAASTSPTSASPSSERFTCETCHKTFSRSHDRKRHYETQHLPTPVVHSCKYCAKEFSRADSLKRHLDNGCDEMPS